MNLTSFSRAQSTSIRDVLRQASIWSMISNKNLIITFLSKKASLRPALLSWPGRCLSSSSNKKGIFIAGTMPDHGKTTVTMGIMHSLIQRKLKPAYQKPIGQHTVTVDIQEGSVLIDHDVDLFKHHWPNLVGSYADCSPVSIQSSLVRDILDGKTSVNSMQTKIVNAFEKLEQQSDYVVVEGAGHVGVGTVIGLNNAQVYIE